VRPKHYDAKPTKPRPAPPRRQNKNKTTDGKTQKKTSEYLGQALLAAALLSSRCWASGLANLALAAFVLERLRRRGEDRCAPADAFGAGSSVHRRNRLALLGCHAFLFALLGFRLVECAAREAMRRHPGGPEGARLLAGELLRAAAASTHGY